MNLARICVCLLVVAGISGCYEIQDAVDDATMMKLSRKRALKSWSRSRHLYRDVEFRHNFREGYIAGYMAVAMGGNTCLPTLPPRKYWTAGYQTPKGRARTLSWFDGYSYGAIAAEQDGWAEWARIPTMNTERPTAEESSSEMPEMMPHGEGPSTPVPPAPPSSAESTPASLPESIESENTQSIEPFEESGSTGWLEPTAHQN